MTAQPAKSNRAALFEQHLSALQADFARAAAALTEEAIAQQCAEFKEVGFVQMEGIFNRDNLAVPFRQIAQDFRAQFNHALKPERPDISKAHTGFSLSRIFLEAEIDADRHGDQGWFETQEKLLQTAETIAHSMTPVLQRITGVTRFVGCKIFAYDEGDYLSIHNDAQLGDRVNMLLPVTFDATACIRVLYDERLRVYYDLPGCINILGPSVWHDVPPLLRRDADTTPLRMNFVIRYE